MALRSQSLFLYGLAVTELNQWVDFRRVNAGPELSAQLSVGYYSLTGLMLEIKRAMEAVDTSNLYTVTANRSVNGGLENRITISTSGAFLQILFSSGTHAVTSTRTLIGFPATDQTGATSYTGTSSAGTLLVTEFAGYDYLSPTRDQKTFGSVNVSASGIKEAVVWQRQRFHQVNFKYEPEDKIDTGWALFFEWAILQRPFDFTPEISSPNVVSDVTLDGTTADGQGLAYRMPEMIPEFPFHYMTGLLKMRVIQ